MNLVKNIGNDGTGVNCQKGDKEFAEIVDTKFDFKCTDEAVIDLTPRRAISDGIVDWIRNEKILFEYLNWLFKTKILNKCRVTDKENK